jgi:hypothetical protein
LILVAREGARPRDAAWLGGFTAFIVAAIFRSSERAPVGLVILFGSALLFPLRPRAYPVWAGFLALLAVTGTSALQGKFLWLVDGGALDRYIVWREGLSLLPGLPVFGYGADSFARVLPPEAWAEFMHRPPASWHNDILQSAIDHGAFVALMLIALITLTLRQSFRPAAWRVDGKADGHTRALGVLFLVFVALGQVNSSVSSAVLGVGFWTTAGLIWSAAHSSRPDNPM